MSYRVYGQSDTHTDTHTHTDRQKWSQWIPHHKICEGVMKFGNEAMRKSGAPLSPSGRPCTDFNARTWLDIWCSMKRQRRKEEKDKDEEEEEEKEEKLEKRRLLQVWLKSKIKLEFLSFTKVKFTKYVSLYWFFFIIKCEFWRNIVHVNN